MAYIKLFDPHGPSAPAAGPLRLGDRGGPGPSHAPVYEYDESIVLAVNVALAAGRPLLVRGDPGTGKSSLARSVAAHLEWRLYAVTVSSRSTARDLLWTFDTVARLADAQAGPGQLRPRSEYVTPGVLWWAFDRDSATRRGATGPLTLARDPAGPHLSPHAVVLVDEIDKADPDVPNDLLLPLGSFQFQLEDGTTIQAERPPLVVITTNEERDLPQAFLRRCVVLALREPSDDRLRAIVRLHFPEADPVLVSTLLTSYRAVRQERIATNEIPPSVAELLDAVAACSTLATSPNTAEWAQLAELLLTKPAPQPATT
ncbi:AAA family ATPase [Jatrophihabitans sp. YIM 134969]